MGCSVPLHTQHTIATAQVAVIGDNPLGTCRQELYSLFSVFVHMAASPIRRQAPGCAGWALWSTRCEEQASLQQPLLCSMTYCGSELEHAHVPYTLTCIHAHSPLK